MVSLTVGRLTTFLYLLFCIHIAQSETVLSSISTESWSNEACEPDDPCFVSSCDSFPYSCLNASQKNMLLERRCWEMLAGTNSVIQGDKIRPEDVANLDPPAMLDSYSVPCCGRACQQLNKMNAYAATLASNPCNPCYYDYDKLIEILAFLITSECSSDCQEYNCSY